MKKSKIITLALAGLMLSFTACEDESNEVLSDADSLELESDAAQEDTFESVDQAVEGGFTAIDPNARIDDSHPRLTDCVVVTHDTENKIITLDFGDGCEDRHGNVRKGQIVIEYNERKYVVGAYRIITFVDFFFNDIGVEGVRTITNTSSFDDQLEFTVTLVDGKLDFGEGVFATRDAEWIRTWFVGQGEVTLSGGAEGTNINGNEYTTTVDVNTPLLFLRECAQRLPVSGIKEIVVGDRHATIDYGDGECDRTVEVTVNGETTTREITPRHGRGRGF